MLDPLIIRLLNRGVDALTVRQICQHCEPGDGRNWRSWAAAPTTAPGPSAAAAAGAITAAAAPAAAAPAVGAAVGARRQ